MATRRPHWRMISAMGPRGEIGLGGKLPWSIPDEWQHFLDSTAGATIVLGRRTWVGEGGVSFPNASRVVVLSTMLAASQPPGVADDREASSLVWGVCPNGGAVAVVPNLAAFAELDAAGALLDRGASGAAAAADGAGSSRSSSRGAAVWVGGGSGVYREAMPLCGEAIITVVKPPPGADATATATSGGGDAVDAVSLPSTDDGAVTVEEVAGVGYAADTFFPVDALRKHFPRREVLREHERFTVFRCLPARDDS